MITLIFLFRVLGKPQKKGGLNKFATKPKVKRTFFNVRKNVPMAIKPRRGGGLVASLTS